jgi:hypothetical protein
MYFKLTESQFTVGDVKTSGNNIQGRIIWRQNVRVYKVWWHNSPVPLKLPDHLPSVKQFLNFEQ